LNFLEEKRQIYDKYGHEGLTGNEGGSRGGPSFSGAGFYAHQPFSGFHFQDPMDLFQQFFGASPFEDIFSK